MRHEDAILFSIFDTWTGRGRLLKAVQFDQQRVRQAFFPKWRKALRRTQKLKAVAAEHNLRLLGEPLWAQMLIDSGWFCSVEVCIPSQDCQVPYVRLQREQTCKEAADN